MTRAVKRLDRLHRLLSGALCARQGDSICRSAVYVTCTYGGVGGRGREAPSYSDLAVSFACGAATLFMIDWSSCQATERDSDRVSGAWVFRGTRIPVAGLFENLEDGAPTSQFLRWFPGVTLEQVRAVLEHAARSSLAAA